MSNECVCELCYELPATTSRDGLEICEVCAEEPAEPSLFAVGDAGSYPHGIPMGLLGLEEDDSEDGGAAPCFV